MRNRKHLVWPVVAVLALTAGFTVGRTQETPQTERIVTVYGVGGVLANDGQLWQYMPDLQQWITIDEAFERDGRETHVLPLPVKPEEVRFMQSWGFLVTHAGEVWHYDLAENRWENVATP